MHAVYFDLDGTLCSFTREYGDLLAEAVDEHVGQHDDALVEAYSEAFYEAFLALDAEPYRAGARAVATRTGVSVDPAAFVDTVRELEYEMVAVTDGMHALLDRLDDRPLGVLTNGVPAWQFGKLEREGLLDRFDATVASYEAGAHKPDSAVFDLAEDRLPADGYVMVGDDYEADVVGAREAGWEAVHLDRTADGVRIGDERDLDALLVALG
ncbi:HAD family hydrolase [Halorarius litoreus]|uniref:HAD family hydrolase n=1 Tax=Halorarius litoreus TaxID=2962676 RepID=UPI0020CF49B1|nr:HAD family hydrolase [Halorarius litoreus]